MINHKDQLKHILTKAHDEGDNYVCVVVLNTDYDMPEMIINHRDAFIKKRDYYMMVYNDDLSLKNAPDKIHIIDAFYAVDGKELIHKCDLFYEQAIKHNLYDKYYNKFRQAADKSE